MTDPAPDAPASAPASKLSKVAATTIDTTTSAARDVARRTAAGIEANPLSVLVGGVALGVLAGAFVPRTEREAKLLGPVGKRITDTAKGAIDAAKDTAKSEFDILGLTRNAARDQAGKLLEGVLGAVTAAATAALATSRTKDAPVTKE